jgi:hypothetical protein
MLYRSWLTALGFVAVAAAAVAAACLLHAGGQQALAVGASVDFEPASSTIVLGVTPVPTVDVSVSNVSGLASYDAWVTFNGSVVQLSNLKDAGFLANPNPQGTPQNVVVCDTPTITPGYGHLACSILPLGSPFPPPVLPSAGSTPLALVHASFNPLTVGTSPLGQGATVSGTPESTTLLDINNTPIAASLGTGSIIVSGAASVGGIAEEPDAMTLPQRESGGASHGTAWYVASVGAGLAVVAAGAAIRRVRRRRS